MTSEVSNVYFSTDNLIIFGDYNINLLSTDNLILFGDYNINLLKETGKQLLINFIADNGPKYVNTKKSNIDK